MRMKQFGTLASLVSFVIFAAAACDGNSPTEYNPTLNVGIQLAVGCTLADGEAVPSVECNVNGSYIKADGDTQAVSVTKSAEVDASMTFDSVNDGLAPGSFNVNCHSLTAGFVIENPVNTVTIGDKDPASLTLYVKRDSIVISDPDKCEATLTVKDESGNALEGVQCMDFGTGGVINSDSDGACKFTGLSCGDRTFTVSEDGFASQSWQTILVANSPASHEFVLVAETTQTDGGVQDDAGQTDGGVQDDAGQSDAPPQDDAGQTDGSNSDAPTPGTIVFKCVKAGSSPLQPLRCTVTEVNLVPNKTCTGNATYGVCAIDGLPFSVSLRFLATYSNCAVASWPVSEPKLNDAGVYDPLPVIIDPGEPREPHEFALSCP